MSLEVPLVIGGAVLALIILLVILVLISRKEDPEAPSEEASSPSDASSPSGHGARSPAPAPQALAQEPPTTDTRTDLDKFVGVLGPLVLGLAISAALDIVLRAIKNLPSATRNLVKLQIRGMNAFRSAIRSKFTVRSAMRSTRKRLLNKLTSLGMAARVRLGMIWSKTLKAAGWTAERITQTLTARLGAEAAQRITARVAARVATKAATLGPFAAFDLAFSGVSLGLDLSNTGGWMNIDDKQTSDLLKAREIMEADLKNSYIGGFKNDEGVVDPATAVGFYPLYWGPLDEMDTVNSDGLDVFDVMIEEQMFTLLFADEPDPFIVKLLTNVAKQYGVTSTNAEDLISASLISDMTQQDYWDLYDRAFDSICISNGGVLVDTGVAGVPKQCSHASETACHAKSPWVEGTGLITAGDDKDITYTEWRDRDFFNKNYSPAQVPTAATGACIIQDPSRHELCSTEEVCRTDACFKNEYIRNRGICQNSATLCAGFGVSTCNRMRKPGESGDSCPTALDGRQADLGSGASILLTDETLKSCYKATGDNWAEFFLGSTIYRYFNSTQFAEDLATVLTGSGTLPGGTTFTTSDVLGPSQGVSDLSYAQGLAAEGAATAAVISSVVCTGWNNGVMSSTGACTTCPDGSISREVYDDDGVYLRNECVQCPPGQMGFAGMCLTATALPWQHAATPTPPGVQTASLPVETSTVSGTQSCPSGSVNSGFGCYNGYCGANTPCLTCPPGQTLSSDTAWCYTCPTGSSWQGSTAGCVASSAPFTVTNAATSEPTVTWSSGVPNSGVATLTCPTGSVKGDYYCYSCPTGQVAFTDSTGNPKCRSCPTGYSPSSDQSYCIKSCPANSVYDTSINDCRCAPGFIKSTDGLSCVALSCSGRTSLQL